MVFIKSLLTRTDVTCVKFSNNYILSGIGGKLHIFDKTETIGIVEVFEGVQIFGILPNISSTRCLVYGENQIKIFPCDLFETDVKEIVSYSFDDWILCAKWIHSDDNIATISMHNIVSLWTNTLELISNINCEENCILYSAYFVNDTWEDLIVLSGTVFGQILIWWPNKYKDKTCCPVLIRLDGHKGVIFSIHSNQSVGVICSTSDDRSARLWSIQHKDLAVELLQSKINIHLKHTLYGHTARVFRCQVLDDFVLTAGEDSLVNIWNLEGELVRKLEAHGNASIWALDYDKVNDIIVTGGGDCGITLFSLNQNIERQEVEVINSEVLKKITILSNGHFIGISENGVLLLYNTIAQCWLKIKQHEDLARYALLETSKCRKFIALAGYHGCIHIYKEDLNSVMHLASHILANKSRIFALHWLSENTFLTCEPEGILHVWLIKNNSISLENQLNLPVSKERWTTTACMCHDEYVAVGDRKGNVYLYSLNCIEPIQIIKKAHNYLGVTNLYFKNNHLTSLGRNSVIKQHRFDVSKKLFLTPSSDKIPFTWIAAICEDDDTTLLLAFLGNEFVIWDYNSRRTLIQFKCGGAHRSWDFYKTANTIKFIYIKDKNLHSIICDSHSLRTRNIVAGFHFNEINSAFCFQFPAINKYLLLSGGEDTTLRISTISFNTRHVKFETTNVFKSHLSSIRAITASKIHSTGDEQHIVFSAGGRAQIILWQLGICCNQNEITVTCSERFSHYEQLSSDESETRIMDLCSIAVAPYVLLIAATSNGTLRVFLVSIDNDCYNMFLVGELVSKLKCILKVRYLKICDHHLVLSMCTGGQIAIWNFTNVIDGLAEFKNNDTVSDSVKYTHVIETLEVHSGGINSFDYKIIDSNHCLFLTGGDDNTIGANLLSFNIDNTKLNIKVMARFYDSSSHCAQITGVFLTNNFFLTVSVDHKLNVFHWFVKDNLLEFVYKHTYNSSIADIQGMRCLEKANAVHAILYGKGIELCEVLNS